MIRTCKTLISVCVVCAALIFLSVHHNHFKSCYFGPSYTNFKLDLYLVVFVFSLVEFASGQLVKNKVAACEVADCY